MAFQRILAFGGGSWFLINVSAEPYSATFNKTTEEGKVVLAPWYFLVDRGEKTWENWHKTWRLISPLPPPPIYLLKVT